MTADADTLPGDVPANPASRLWWAVPAVGIVLLALVSIFFGGGPEKVDFGTSYDASAGGSRAAFLLLEELGYPVERSRRPAGGAVRWVLFPTRTAEKDAAALNDWVRRGGLLLLATDERELAGHLGLTVTVLNAPNKPDVPGELKLSRPRPSEKAESYAAKAPDVARLYASDLEVLGPGGGEPWGEIDDDPLVTIYSHDRGEVWLLHRPDVLTNDNLRKADNAVLACRLAEAMLAERPGGKLAFDEFCHGLRDRPDVTELLFRPPVLGVTLQVLLLGALALWRFGVRFGPVRSAPPPPRRSKEEFLDAMAELLARNGDRAEAYRTVRDAFRRRLEDDLGLPADTPVEQTVREAARRRGVPPEPLLRLLAADAPPDGRGAAAFLAALHQLESAAHDCFRTRPRPR